MPPYGLEFPLSGNLLILGNPLRKVNFEDSREASIRNFFIRDHNVLSVPRSLSFAAHLVACIESPTSVFGIVVDLRYLVDVVSDMRCLHRAPNSYEFVWEVDVDLQNDAP